MSFALEILYSNNIVFDRKGTEGVLKIIDFGESLIVDPEGMYEECVGTIHFVSLSHNLFLCSMSPSP